MRIQSLQDALTYFPDIDGVWAHSNLSSTEDHIRSKLPADPAGPWSSEAVEMLTQLARAKALQGQLTDAQVLLDEVNKKVLEGNYSARTELRALLEQGRVICLAMSPSKANDVFMRAWNKANETGEIFFAIDAALMLSTIRPPKFQNEWLKKALTMAEEATDPQARLWLAQLLFLDGWHAFDFRLFEKALELFDKALTQPLVIEQPAKDMPLQWSRARTLRALGQTQEALAIQESLLKRMNERGAINGHVYLEIAECKQLLKQKEDAKTYFEMAYASLSADGWYSDNKTDELERMKYLYKKR